MKARWGTAARTSIRDGRFDQKTSSALRDDAALEHGAAVVIRRGDVVEDPAPGSEYAPIAGPSQSKSQVDVLVVRDQEGVEAAGDLEGLGPVEGATAAGSEDFVSRPRGPGFRRLAVSALRRPAHQGIGIPSRVDPRRVGPDEHQRRHGPDRLVGERSQGRLDPAGGDFRVVVEELDEGAPCRGDPRVRRHAKAAVLLQEHQSKALLGLSQPFRRAVGGPVIDDHDLDRKRACVRPVPLDAGQAATQQLAAVVGQDHDRAHRRRALAHSGAVAREVG